MSTLLVGLGRGSWPKQVTRSSEATEGRRYCASSGLAPPDASPLLLRGSLRGPQITPRPGGVPDKIFGMNSHG